MTGEVAVYPLRTGASDQVLFRLGIRQRLNPELSYFVALKSTWEEHKDSIIKLLSAENLSEKAIELFEIIQPVA
jgi:hypothetical protein